MDFLIYEGKVAVALLVFYLFYRFLLKKETFHRFNRVVLVGTAVLSFLLPLCKITIHKPMDVAPVVQEPPVAATELPVQDLQPLVVSSIPWWPTVLAILFWAGVAFVLIRIIVSILSIVRIIRQGQLVREENGCKIIVTERDIDPFSWMHYIVLPRKDWDAPHASILEHEKAHIGFGHSIELLMVDVLSALQWFNPAIWMLRADLQELHEYEADDAVLRAGTNIKEYQYLLIRKAVSKSGYSVANSFNHSILKNRITMMSKPKSPLSRGLRVLYLIPLTCIGLGMQARTIYVAPDKDNEKILSERLSGTARTGVFQKNQAVLPEIVVVKYADASVKPEDINHGASLEDLQISDVLEADTAPVCSENFAMWLNTKLFYPQGCLHDGTVLVRFTVNKNGKVSDVNVMNGICEELDNAVVKLIEKSPVWTPATRKGKKVAVQLVQPVIFAIRTK